MGDCLYTSVVFSLKMITHLSTNWDRWGLTSLTETNKLSLSQTARVQENDEIREDYKATAVDGITNENIHYPSFPKTFYLTTDNNMTDITTLHVGLFYQNRHWH